MSGLQALGKKTAVNGLGHHLSLSEFAKISHSVCLFSVSVRCACSSSCVFSIRFCFSFLCPRVHTTVSRVQAGRKRGWRYNNLITSTGFHQGRSQSLGYPSTRIHATDRFPRPEQHNVCRSFPCDVQVQISCPSRLNGSNKFLKTRNGLTLMLNKSMV